MVASVVVVDAFQAAICHAGKHRLDIICEVNGWCKCDGNCGCGPGRDGEIHCRCA